MSDEPWKDEPDALDFIDDATSYPIALRRGPVGAWCGYIGVPKDHPWHGKGYSEAVKAPRALTDRAVNVDELGAINIVCAGVNAVPEENIWPIDVLVRCHGGLTYAKDAWWEGETRASWWFGFDCSHAGDIAPKHIRYGIRDGVYRDVDFARAAASLAASDLAIAALRAENAT